jgi:hypothetical protein
MVSPAILFNHNADRREGKKKVTEVLSGKKEKHNGGQYQCNSTKMFHACLALSHFNSFSA